MKCQIFVDWLTFSVKRKDPKEVTVDFLGLDPALFQEEGYGLMGYTQVLKFSNILVCYEPREDGYFPGAHLRQGKGGGNRRPLAPGRAGDAP